MPELYQSTGNYEEKLISLAKLKYPITSTDCCGGKKRKEINQQFFYNKLVRELSVIEDKEAQIKIWEAEIMNDSSRT